MTQSEVIEKINKMSADASLNAKLSIQGSKERSYFEGQADGYSMAQEVIEGDDIYPDWIPFTEREPDDDCVVIVTLISGTVTVACYIDNDFHTMGDQVVAWMPLPEPYKEVDASD